MQAAENPARSLWLELCDKFDKYPNFHQEFEVTQRMLYANNPRQSTYPVVLDRSAERWRQVGLGDTISLYSGSGVIHFESGGQEYVRDKEGQSAPVPYSVRDSDWTKAVEVQRLPCGYSGHQCVVFDVPVKTAIHALSGGKIQRVLGGVQRLQIDLTTGMIVSYQSVENHVDGQNSHQVEMSYVTKRFTLESSPNQSLFELPSASMRQVKALSPWDAERIRRTTVGIAAPDFQVTDMKGRPVSLGALRGKIVLLDFWATWCPPCRADGPSLDKLYSKYGRKELEIIGISVGEDRETVEKYLAKVPHAFANVLSTENYLSSSYRFSAIPTYIVIDKDGNIASAAQGVKGFGELKKLLKKAGLDPD